MFLRNNRQKLGKIVRFLWLNVLGAFRVRENAFILNLSTFFTPQKHDRNARGVAPLNLTFYQDLLLSG